MNIKALLTMNEGQLKAAAAKAARQSESRYGLICPACGSRETESNGHTEHRCDACDHRWGFEGGEWYGIEVVA